MSRGGHNWKGFGTVEGARWIDVVRLHRAGFLSGPRLGNWQWTYQDGTTALVGIMGGRDNITLDYRFRTRGQDWEPVEQRVPIRWIPCHFGGERPWFVCDVRASGVYCGRQVARLYGAGRLFACRHCYRLGYQVQRGGGMDQAHHHLARLHRKLKADYEGPDVTPPKPKWMRWRTYSRIAAQIDAGQERLDVAFIAGSQHLLARIERSKRRRRVRR